MLYHEMMLPEWRTQWAKAGNDLSRITVTLTDMSRFFHTQRQIYNEERAAARRRQQQQQQQLARGYRWLPPGLQQSARTWR